MHWIRIDHYEAPPDAAPGASGVFQPVPCMHCENAPCEIVCPVGATVHDSEGLNVQVYNRCVGTRFCSNNCPYKVRRFNFLQYSDEDTAAFAAQHNPDVTVRVRGVMEKCTYCVQRISHARLMSEKSGKPLVGRRRRHGLPVGLPDRGDPLRRPGRSGQRRDAHQGLAASLRVARRTEHAPAHHLSCAGGAATRTPHESPSGRPKAHAHRVRSAEACP